MIESEMVSILPEKRAEFTGKQWTVENARMVFEGLCGSMPFDVCQSVGLYVAKHCNDGLVMYARKILRVKPKLKLTPGGNCE